MRIMCVALLALSCFVCSCGISDPELQTEREIRDLVYELGRSFNWGDINAIMNHVHPEFRHKGMYEMQLRQLWLDRLARFSLMDTQIQRVEVKGDYATVFLKATFSSANETVYFDEPQDNGDYSYFYYDQGRWRLYGNQLWIKADTPHPVAESRQNKEKGKSLMSASISSEKVCFSRPAELLSGNKIEISLD